MTTSQHVDSSPASPCRLPAVPGLEDDDRLGHAVTVEPLVPVVERASTTDTEASPRQVWVEIMTTQEVVAVGLRTILENAEGHLSITTKGPLDAGSTRSRTSSCTT